jgi:hypothetical protein
VTFIYANNEHAEEKIRKALTFITASKIAGKKPKQRNERP